MKLRTRQTLAASAVITVVSLGVSYTALVTVESSEFNRVNRTLDYVISSASDGSDPLTSLVETASGSATPLTTAVVTYGGDITFLSDTAPVISTIPSLKELKAAAVGPVSVQSRDHYQMRSFEYSDGEYLVVATSLAAIDANRAENISRFRTFTLLAILAGALSVNFLIGRDLRVIRKLISSADDISRGELEVSLATSRSSAEVEQLSAALERMLQSLSSSIDLQKQLQARMQEFLGDASHELRTPLTVIKGYVELLSSESGLDTESRHRALDRLNTEIVRMEALINDLLLLTELGERQSFTWTEVDLSEIVRASFGDLSALQPERHVSVDVPASLLVLGVQPLLSQLVANITSNIRRHTPSEAAVSAVLRRNGNLVELHVQDGGPGLDLQHYQLGIQHFQRFDPSRNRASGGSGLGMSIMAAIVAQHGGQIELSRSDLGGLGIRILLPQA